jgi:hypothetical protein
MEQVNISGLGWIKKDNYGTLSKAFSFKDLDVLPQDLLKSGYLKRAIKSYSRFDRASKLVVCSTAIAMADAGIDVAPEKKLNVGMFASGTSGCVDSNQSYFKDYVNSGRKLARGNLFIYTLPTSPLAEASIYFGFTGPILYCEFSRFPLKSLLKQASSCLFDGGLENMLAVFYQPEFSVSLVLTSNKQENKSFQGFLDKIKNDPGINDPADYFA